MTVISVVNILRFVHDIVPHKPKDDTEIQHDITANSSLTEAETNRTMTNSRIRKGISYVIGDIDNNENHILPINAMKYSTRRKQLFTGGRDGIIKCWNNGDSYGGTAIDDDTFGDILDPDERLLKLETYISSKSVPYNKTSGLLKVDSQHNNYNIHFDWINDLQLVNNDNNLVSCSSDLSLKIIHLNQLDQNVSKFENIHTDYVKKLSYFDRQGILLSGGLDGKIVMWDLSRLNPIGIINNSNNASSANSIYSLANNNSNLISSGGPNNTINIFDRRLNGNNFVKKLISHQDNVRCLLMNDNFIVSGSSDSTIKLWDLRNFKILKNFSMHDDPIWCLELDHANFNVFYSADKAGNIFKTDCSYLSNDDESPTYHLSEFTERLGLSILLAKSSSSIISLGIENDNSIFASTDMSLDRYYIPNTTNLANYQYLRISHDYDNQYITDDLNLDSKTSRERDDINSDIYDLVSHLSMDTTFDLQSNLSNNIAASNEETDDSEYNSMFLNVNGGPSMDFVNFYKETPTSVDNEVDLTPVEILLNPLRLDQITLIPFNKQPFFSCELTPKSVIVKRLFNNKRTILVLYLNGDVAIWDLLICKQIKSFPYNGNNSIEVTSEMIKKRIKDMDDIFQQYQTTDTLNNWCEVEIKLGKLLVTISETSFNNVEIYYDEMVKSYPFLKMELDEDAVKNPLVKVTNDDRLQVSRILLNSIFYNFALYEWNFDAQVREKLKDLNKLDVKDTKERLKLFSRKSSSSLNRISSRTSFFSGSAENSNVNSTNVSTNVSINDDNKINEFILAPDKCEDSDSIDFLLNDNKVKYKELLANSSKVPDSLLRLYSNKAEYLKHVPRANDEPSTYKPRISFKELPLNLLIIIFENSPDLGNLRDLFSFRLGELSDLSSVEQNYDLVKNLRTFLPKWIGLPILYDRFPLKVSPKVSFILLEMDYTTLPPEKKINGKSQRKIKKLPVLESSIKLSSHNMLRVSKILTYVIEKFESRTPEMKEKLPANQWLVLECKGQELDNDMTLQTIKTKIWKSNSDVELRFRRKFDK